TTVVPSTQARRRAGLSRLLRPRIAATLTAGALALFGGLAEAGALPGPVQHVAHVLLGSVGISVPDSGSSSGSALTHGSGPVGVWPDGRAVRVGRPSAGGGTSGQATTATGHRHQRGLTEPRHAATGRNRGQGRRGPTSGHHRSLGHHTARGPTHHAAGTTGG